MQTLAVKKEKRIHRFGEFDLLKALAILGLPAVHILEEGLYNNVVSDGVTSLEAVIVALCILGPSVFMICMGFSMGGTRSSPYSLMKQGFRFLFLGAVLNILRWLLPGILLYVFEGDSLVKHFGFCLASDIYFFVGFFCLFYALIRKLNMKTPALIVTSIVMLTVNTLLTPLTAKLDLHVILESLLGNIVYISDTSCFPLLSWAIFPSIGIVLGDVLKKVDDGHRQSLMNRMIVFSPLVFVSFFVFLWSYDFDLLKVLVSPLNEYVTDLPNVVLTVALALFLFGVLYYVCKAIDKSRFMAFMAKIATYIVPFYVLQWLLVSWLIVGLDLFNLEMNLGWFLLSVAAITGICIYVSIKHGLKFSKFLARMTSFKIKRKKRRIEK